jgi:hypothetical protein
MVLTSWNRYGLEGEYPQKDHIRMVREWPARVMRGPAKPS